MLLGGGYLRGRFTARDVFVCGTLVLRPNVPHTHTHTFLSRMENFDRNKLNSRLYSWEIISYVDDNDINYWIDCIKSYQYTVNYLCILHDKDMDLTTGSLIKPHIHTYITLRRETSRTKLARDLNVYSGGNYIVLKENITYIKGSLSDCYEYALHLNEPDKYHYDVSSLFSSDLRRFKRCQGLVDNKGFSVLEDFENGLSLREMAIKYGRDFIIHYDQYRYFYDCMSQEEVSRRKLEEKKIEIIQEDFD